MIHGPPGLSRWAGFFLSVAGYVVKPKTQDFKSEKKYEEQKRNPPYSAENSGFCGAALDFEGVPAMERPF